MKRSMALVTILVLTFSLFVNFAEAASSRLKWVTYDPETGDIVEDLTIEDGGSYQVPFGVTREIFAESDLAEFGAVGSLYFIDSETSQREFITDVGGSSGIDEFAWDKEGVYEIDFYLNDETSPTMIPWYKTFFASIFPDIAYAFEEAFFLETISFTITEEGSLNEINPVIIIPGIMGSYLNRSDLSIDKERWPNIFLMTISPDDLFLNDLILTDGGLSSKSILSTNVLDKIQNFDFFNGLVNELSLNDLDVYIFPYDWRLDINDVVIDLNSKINEVKVLTGADEVDIIAHSMGGLLLKNYLKNYPNNTIGKFIDVGTPQIGSPKAFKILNYGDNFGFEKFGLDILNQQRTKIISQNMPSVYQLLPTMAYGTYLYDLDDLDENGVSGSLSYSQTKEFMKNMGRNPLLVDRAEQFHQEIDTINPTDYGVETYNIVGCGTPTLDKIFVLNKEASGGVKYNISYTNGDGTVPLRSAEALSANETYYLKNATHALMPSTSGVKELITSILKNQNLDISQYSNLSLTSSGCSIPNGQIVSFHSPIDLHIYSGNYHTGPNANGDVEDNIPGVDYEVIDGNKFAFLPDGFDYTIKGVATGNGTFDAQIQKVTNETVTNITMFSNVPLTSTTQVIVGASTLSIDDNADGKPDQLIYSDNTELSTIIKDLKDKIKSLNIKDKLKKNLLNKIENIEKKIEKKKNDKSLDGLRAKIQNIINKVIKKESKGQIGDTDTQDIINLLEQVENKL